MLRFITQPTDPLLEYIKDDPVRPDIPAEFRVSNNRFISALVEEKPQAMVCVSLHNFVPSAILLKENNKTIFDNHGQMTTMKLLFKRITFTSNTHFMTYNIKLLT